ncbi:hypothetical protein [Kitasatospora paranensis]|uniref:DUF1648 domain-containing protein n=1 Tax=Kitasatospora paranensis TaxID=258053 RepID=A0ABW2G5Q1_9ACTN
MDQPAPRTPRRRTLALPPHLLAAGTVALTYLGLHGRLPDPMAAHFSGSRTDGTMAPLRFLLLALALQALVGVVSVAFAHRADGPMLRGALAAGYAAAALLGGLFTALLAANADAGTADRVSFPGGAAALALAAAAAAGALGLLLAGRSPGASATGPRTPAPVRPAEPLDLGTGDRGAWSRTAGSPALRTAGPALLALAAIVWAAGSPAGAAPIAAAGLLVAAGARIRVTVDRHGLTVGPPLLRRPHLHIPLERIAAAGTRQVRARAEFGGWGHRLRPGTSGIVMRSGEALALRLTDGSEFVVTVADAATAAGLLTALLQRSR